MLTFDIETIHRLLWGEDNGEEEIQSYACPCCERRFDVEEVRKYTDNGEVPTCLECGEELVPVEEGD